MLELTTERNEDILSIGVAGRIDRSNAAEFTELLHGAIEPTDRAVIMYFRDLAYINSTGLVAVVAMPKSLRAQDAKLVLRGLPEPIRTLS